MKVCHVVIYYPPDRVGGVGEVVAHLHRGLLAAGHTSVVITRGHTRDDPTVKRIAKSPLGFLAQLPRQAEFASCFDVVHCHHGDALGLLLAMRLRFLRTPVLATFHVGHAAMRAAHRPYWLEGRRFGASVANWRYRNITGRFHQFTDSLIRRLAKAVTFISRSSAVDHLGMEKGAQATVIYNALPPHNVTANTKHVEPTELIYVGTYGDRKRVFVLPFLLARVRSACPGARMRIIGFDLADRPMIRQLFEEFSLLDAVVCEGSLQSDQVPPFYRAAKVLVVPSCYEGLPMVVLEALNQRLPCVATRVSGHPEVIENGVNGFLVDPDDIEEMADCCVKILKNDALQRQLGEAGPPVVAEKFGLPRQVDEYLQVYRDMAPS